MKNSYGALIYWIAVLITFLCCPTAYSETYHDPRINPETLVKRQVFGSWRDGHDSGVLRYSMYQAGSEEVQTILVVEWIEVNRKTGNRRIISRREIIPMQGVFKPPMIVSTHPYTLRVAIGTIVLCGKLLKYDIILTGVGKYSIKSLNYDAACDPAAPY